MFILCSSYVHLMYNSLCALEYDPHAIIVSCSHDTSFVMSTQVGALAPLKHMALAYLQVCNNGRIPSTKLVDALRFGVKEGLLNIGFVLEA